MDFEQATEFLVNFIEKLGYFGIFFMTLIESTFIPIPAELTMIPAGYLVHEGKLDFTMVFIASVAGSVGGGYINYWIAYHYGRTLLLRHPKIFMMSHDKFERVEEYFKEHGAVSVFTGRLLPAVKHYIGFPAGLARMKLSKYLFYCVLSGVIWMGVLLTLGYMIGEHSHLIKRYLLYVKLGLVAFAGLLISIYLVRFYKGKKAKQLDEEKASEGPSEGN